MEPFRYRPVGTLASIGHYTGVGVVFGIQVQGLVAWLTWRGYYWSRVPGMAGKLRVAFDWLLGLVFGSDPVQLKVDYPGRAGMGPSGTRRPRQRTTDLRG
jgi:NADH dehydrogenase